LAACQLVLQSAKRLNFDDDVICDCSWVPVSSKSRSLGLAYSAGQIGNIVALVTSPLLINNFGWKSAFWVYGTLGLTWMLAWVPLVPDQPPNKTKALQGGVSLRHTAVNCACGISQYESEAGVALLQHSLRPY